jgi:hypothetical protein
VYTLDVFGNFAWGGHAGYLGTDPSGQIELGPTSAASATPYIDFHYGLGVNTSQDFNFRLVNSGDGRMDFVNVANGTVMTIVNNGVGIGITPSSTTRLAVNGKVAATEVVVTTSPGADYVFDPGYRLAPLGEVAKYVEANRHLPGIPGADEMAAEGVDLAEMQAKLLAKIEELTLHMIRAEERENRMERENRELRARMGLANKED